MSDLSKEAIQKEIEAKKKRLEELKQKRLQRQQRHDETTTSPNLNIAATITSTSTSTLSHSHSASPIVSSIDNNSSNTISSTNADYLLDVVNNLITATPAVTLTSTATTSTSAPTSANLHKLPSSSAQQQPHPQSYAHTASPSSALTISASRPSSLVVLHRSVHPSVDIPPVEIIKYDLAVQTMESYLVEQEMNKDKENSADYSNRSAKNNNNNNSRDMDDMDEIDQIRKERDALRRRETELMTTLKQVNQELEEARIAASNEPNIRDNNNNNMSHLSIDNLSNDQSFQSFFTRSSLMMERFLSDRTSRLNTRSAANAAGYDFTIDYNADDDDQENDTDTSNKTEKLSYKLTFSDTAKTLHRPISSLDWSHKHPELLLASYAAPTIEGGTDIQMDEFSANNNSSMLSSSSAQGCVLLWNIHLSSRPEYHFTADSSILSVAFHPTHPKLLIGSTSTGQLLMWDTRSKRTPVNRTSLANSHTSPIYVCRMIPLMNGNYNILSVSSDGHACIWNEENWHQPQQSYHLIPPRNISSSGSISSSFVSSTSSVGSSYPSDISVNCLDSPGRDHHTLVIGSEEGHLYKAKLYEHKERDDKDMIYEMITTAHSGPISGITFHPLSACSAAPSHLISTMYLTCSYDWSVKLWSQHLSTPLSLFESAKDYLYDVAWHPINPYLFVTGDATGKLDLWRLGVRNQTDTNSANNETNNNNDNSTLAAQQIQPQITATGTATSQQQQSYLNNDDNHYNLLAEGWEVPYYSIHVRDKETSTTPIITSMAAPTTTTTTSAANPNDVSSNTSASSNSMSSSSSSGVHHSGPAISKLRWDHNGGLLAVGSSQGSVTIFELINELAQPTRQQQEYFWDYCNKKILTGAAGTGILGGTTNRRS